MNLFLRVFVLTLVFSILSILYAQPNSPGKSTGSSAKTKTSKLETEKEKISYMIGWSIGTDLKSQGIEIVPDTLVLGIKNYLSGTPPLLTNPEMQTLSQKLRQQMMLKQQEERKNLSDKTTKEGEEFLRQNKNKDGVKTTASGLQYKIIQEGTGAIPVTSDTVKVHYRGTLIDGKEFDSSYKRNEPATFPLNGVIKGWTEGLQLMKVGSKYMLYVPSDLAYGDRGAGADIPPGATLIFEVELLEIINK